MRPLSLLLNVSYNISHRIVNGYGIDISEVPYHASIHVSNYTVWWYLCGAVIIHETATLTASHCIDGLQEYYWNTYGNKRINIKKIMRINVGRTLISYGGDNYDITKIINYPAKHNENILADIAILVIKGQFNFNHRVKYIPYAPKNYKVPDGTEALVSGFGTTSYKNDTSYSRVLLAAKVHIMDHTKCTRAYERVMNITSSVICAVNTVPPRGACTGDSGGPLVANGYLIGIVSFGVECQHSIYPEVYTRVSYFYDWIKSNLRQKKKLIQPLGSVRKLIND